LTDDEDLAESSFAPSPITAAAEEDDMEEGRGEKTNVGMERGGEETMREVKEKNSPRSFNFFLPGNIL
jgi:hypothetical protein